MHSIMYCEKCKEYTFDEICPRCREKTVSKNPPRLSPQDNYGVYRRKLKKLEKGV